VALGLGIHEIANKNDSNRGQKTVQIGQVYEVDIALPITVRKTAQRGQAREVDTALPITVLYTINLLLQTVIVAGVKTDEGQLIVAVTLPWFEIIAFLSRDPSLAYQITARKWEEIIAGAYQRAGFDEVTLTPRSGDLGRDVIAVKRGLGTVRIIDQVKAYGPNHLVTADDVRALLGVLQGDKASKGFLTTTSDFAPKLRDDILLKPFMPAQLELINGKMLLARLEGLAKKKA
jgi:restriction system protein